MPPAAWEPLRRWAAQTGTRFWPADWSARGNTARVVAVYAERAGERPRKLVVKYCPPGDDLLREPGRHARAKNESPPEFYERHLVDQPWDALALADNAWIMFQQIASGSLRDYRSLDDALGGDGDSVGLLADVSGRVVSCVLGEWNPDGPRFSQQLAGAPDFLRALLGARIDPGGKIDQWARRHPHLSAVSDGRYPSWVRLPGERGAFPHPIALARDPALTPNIRLMPLLGRAHGDLHFGNVIAPVREESGSRFLRFIDLSGYDSNALLARDPAHLLLSTAGSCLATLTQTQRATLGRLIVRPRDAETGPIPKGLYELCGKVEEAGARWAEENGFPDEWAEQRLLALVGCGLLFAARRTTRDEHREWFFHLAARAAGAYLELRGSGAPKADASPSRSPRSSQGIEAARAPSPGRAAAAPRDEGRRSWNLPPLIPYAVHRAGPLAEVRRRMEEHSSTTVALYGAPGTGKTHLAAEYARLRNADGDRVAWFACARPELLGDQLAELARDLLGDVPADTAAAADELFAALGARGSWLLVFDDAPDAERLAPFVLPARRSGMRVLITSRSPHFGQLADCMELTGFERTESARLLARLVDQMPEAEALAVATALDDLPLLLVQAAEFLHSSAMTVDHYLRLLKTSTTRVVSEGKALNYPISFGAALDVALKRLERDSPQAVRLLHLCARFAPAPIPFDALADGFRDLPAGVAEGGDCMLTLAATVAAASGSGLLRVGYGRCQLHRLVQAVLRDGLSDEDDADLTGRARRVLAAARPGDPEDPGSWPRYRDLLPHMLEVGLLQEPEASSRRLVLDVTHYLVATGDARAALKIAQEAFDTWRAQSGPDDEATLAMESRLAQAYFYLQKYAQACELDEDVLTRRRLVLGEAHPDTFAAMDALAVDLTTAGRQADPPNTGVELLVRAGELYATVIAARSGAAGDSHPDTLRSMHNLAFHLRAVGDVEGARALEEVVFAGYADSLGERHPRTLRSAYALAHDLRTAGDRRRAGEVQEAVYIGYRDTLGGGHLDTLRAAQVLVGDLHAIGEHSRARELHTDTVNRLLRRSHDTWRR